MKISFFSFVDSVTDPAQVGPNNDFFLYPVFGPWQRSDYQDRFPQNAARDTYEARNWGCDIVTFLVFNDFTSVAATDGFATSGVAVGGACEQEEGRGFIVVADQGKLRTEFPTPVQEVTNLD